MTNTNDGSEGSCGSDCSTACVTSMSASHIEEWFSYLLGAVIRARGGHPPSECIANIMDNLKRLAILGSEVAADRADAEKYRALMKSLGNMSTVHPPVWDSRNMSQ